MADIVNLRVVRKRKIRAEKEQKAEENRVSFGMTKGERQRAEDARQTLERHVEAHRRERGEPE